MSAVPVAHSESLEISRTEKVIERMSDETEARINAAIAKYTRSNATFILLMIGQTVVVSSFIFQIHFKTLANENALGDLREEYKQHIISVEEKSNALIRLAVAMDRTTADIAELKTSMKSLERTATLFENYIRANPTKATP